MSVDTPARIAIIGAGPIGLEAGLYARYLGYEVALFERGQVCAGLLQVGETPLPTPAGQNRTSLGLGALLAQNPDYAIVPAAQPQTARQLFDSYLQPLANSDLLLDSIHPEHEVLLIQRAESSEVPLPEVDEAGEDEEEDSGEEGELEADSEQEAAADELPPALPFKLTGRRADGSEFTYLAEVVIDASGLVSEQVSTNSAASPERLPDHRLWAKLNVPVDSSTLCPIGEQAQESGPRALLTPERNFYVLGSKRSGRAGDCTLAAGHEQIRQLFTIIGDRAGLNLYATFQPQ